MKLKMLIAGLVCLGISGVEALPQSGQSRGKNHQVKAEVSQLLQEAEHEVGKLRYDKAINIYKEANVLASGLDSGCKPDNSTFISGSNYYYEMAMVYRVWGKAQVPAIRRGNYRRALAALGMAVRCETTYKQAMRRLKALEGFLSSDLGQGQASLKAFQKARTFPVGDSTMSNRQLDSLIMRIKQVLRK